MRRAFALVVLAASAFACGGGGSQTSPSSSSGSSQSGDTPLGTLLVQMLTDSRIEVEASFSGNARFFIR